MLDLPFLSDWLRARRAKRDYDRLILEALAALVHDGTIELLPDHTYRLADPNAQRVDDLLEVLEHKLSS